MKIDVRRWSGGPMVLGKLQVPGRPTIWMIVGHKLKKQEQEVTKMKPIVAAMSSLHEAHQCGM